jgi:hypothetical protein
LSNSPKATFRTQYQSKPELARSSFVFSQLSIETSEKSRSLDTFK